MDSKDTRKVSFILVVSELVFSCTNRQRIYHGTVNGRGWHINASGSSFWHLSWSWLCSHRLLWNYCFRMTS